MNQLSDKNNPGIIDQSNVSADQQRLMNRDQFNKSHDYKRKSDKNKLDIGKIQPGHPEDYDTLIDNQISGKNMMA